MQRWRHGWQIVAGTFLPTGLASPLLLAAHIVHAPEACPAQLVTQIGNAHLWGLLSPWDTATQAAVRGALHQKPAQPMQCHRMSRMLCAMAARKCDNASRRRAA